MARSKAIWKSAMGRILGRAAVIGVTLMPLAMPAPVLAQSKPPKVVASIQPLHSLAAAVMRGVGSPALLVQGKASEHGYALRPSDARQLHDADLVVLVDREYETFLDKPLEAKPDGQSVEMAELPGIILLSPRQGGPWEAHRHHESPGPNHDGHDHDHDETHVFDGHAWLSPANAKILVTALAGRLSALDPEHAAQYAANAQDELARLDQLDARIREKLSPVADRPFVVFHDAYQYFEKHYGLTGAGSITLDPDQPPSAKRLAALRQKLVQSGTACIFREPQFPAKVIDTLAKSADARIGVLDPQGADIPPGPDQYVMLMDQLADNLAQCLSPDRSR